MYKRDRFSMLRSLLSTSQKNTEGHRLLMLREIGAAIIQMGEDLSTLDEMRASLARMEKNYLDFARDTLEYRLKKIQRESEDRPDEVNEEMTTTQDLLKKLEDRNRRIQVSEVRASTSTPTLQFTPEPKPIEKFWNWFRDRVAPGLTTWILILVLGSIGFAIWTAIRAAILAP